MSSLETRKIEPATGTTVTLGAGGDTVLVSASQLKTNTVKDAGGNTLWTSDGSGNLSNVNSKLSGSMVFISSQTVSSAVSELLFTTGIDSTYDEYMFVLINCRPATDNVDFGFQTSTNGGSSYGISKTTTAFYALHNESDSQAVLNYSPTHDYPGNPDTEKQWIAFGVGNDSDESCSGIIHFFKPSSTTYVKHFYMRTNSYGMSVETVDFFAAGYWNTTSALDAFRFAMFSGNIAAGTIALYGIS